MLIEGLQDGQCNYSSLLKQSHALLENRLWDFAIENIDHLPVVTTQLLTLRSLFVESTRDLALHRPALKSKATELETALDQAWEFFDTTLNFILDKSRGTALEEYYPKEHLYELHDQIEKAMAYPTVVHTHLQNGASQITEAASTETETSAQSTTTAENSSFVCQAAQKSYWGYLNSVAVHPLWACFQHAELRDFIPLFQSVDLHISHNAMITFLNDSIHQPGWVNGYMKPIHYLVYLDEKITLIHSGEAARLRNAYPDLWMWLVNFGEIGQQIKMSTEQQEQFRSRIMLAEMAAKLLNGDLFFTAAQWNFFTHWLSKEQCHDRLMGFIHKILCPAHPSLAASGGYLRVKAACTHQTHQI
jgi:hypothetical protein